MVAKRKKIINSILSATMAITCFLAVISLEKKEGTAETGLRADYVSISSGDATFSYQTLPEEYQDIYTYKDYNYEVKNEPTTSVKGAMVFSAFNHDSASPKDVSITFSTVVSAKRLTSSFNLLEYLVISDEFDWASDYKKDLPQFSGITLKLAERANPENYVKITNLPSPYHNYASVVRASTANISPAGKGKNGSFYDSSGVLSGSGIRGSLSGCYLTGNEDNPTMKDIFSVSYKFDNASNTAYAYPTEGNTDILVRDLDDSTQIWGKDEIFGGFETDELIATVSFDDLKGKAEIAILGFNGAKLYADTEEGVKDENKPRVYATDYNNEIKAEVGKPFPLFNFESYDDVDGLGDIDNCKVFYNYGTTDETEIPLSEGVFIPQVAGNYAIVADKTDSSGNKGKVEYVVEAVKKLPPFILSLDGEIAEYNIVGHSVNLPDAIVGGGTFGTDYKLSVIYQNQEITLDKYNGFVIESQGVYTVRYSVYDYRKTPTNFDYYIEAKLDKKPIVEFPNMPKYVRVGSSVKIPEFLAVDWYSYAGIPCNAEVYATVQKGSGAAQRVGKEYMVTEKGEFTYTLTAKSVKTSEGLSQSYRIEAIETELVSDYFVREKMEISGEEDIIFEAKENGASMSFINALPVNNFSLRFFIPEEYNNFTRLTLIFSDKYSIKERVTVDCTPNGNTGLLKICGTNYKVDSAFDGSDFSFGFKDLSLINLGDEVTKIAFYDNGAEYTGFSSGYVYVDFVFSGITDKAGITLKTLGNHSYFDLQATDISNPMIKLASEVKTLVKIGDIINIPKVSAFDVFECETEVKVRVTKDGKSVKIVDDSFVITEFGTYIMRIESTDSTSHKTAINKNMYCRNTTGPTISIIEKVETTGKIGKSIQIANAKAVDYFGKDVEVRTFVLKKGGEYVMTDEEGKFTLNESNDYVIWYVATDSDFNTTVIKYTVKV